MGLKQHVKKPTHQAGHTIDVLINYETDDLDIHVDVKDFCFSDLFPTFCMLEQLTKSKRPQSFISMRNHRFINHEAVAVDLRSAADRLSTLSLNQGLYDSLLINVLDKHAPSRSIRVAVRWTSPWMNGDILRVERLKRKFEATCRNSKLEIHRQQYSNQRNELNKKIALPSISSTSTGLKNAAMTKKLFSA